MTLIEFAIMFTLLLMLSLGAYEYGMVFRDSLTVATASREAGRVAASTANFGDADCVILEAAAGALQSLDTGAIDRVHIYKSDAGGAYAANSTLVNIYRPAGADTPDLICTGSSWLETIGGNWDPGDRVNTEGAADWIGVKIDYSHQWQTGFLWWNGSMALADDAIFRIEPPAPT
ncbi:MAG: pilus assembly protein [Actinobacteria bacterium]|nr:pilus assembly protein [Actinomycetota bacterium]